MKKWLSMILCIVMVCNLSTTAFASNIENDPCSTPEEIYREAQRMAAARGIQLLDASIVFSANSKLEQTEIENTVSPAAVSVPSSATSISEGTGKTKTLTAGGELWFVFTTPSAGAYNIYTTGSTNTYGELYKKGLLGLSLVSETGSGGSGTNFYIKDDLKNNTTYYVKVTGQTTTVSGSFTLYVKGNKDSQVSSNGGEWNWTTNVEDPDGVYFNIDQITYLNATQATGYYNIVATDNVKKVRDAILNLTTTKAIEYLMAYYGVSSAVATWILDALAIGSAVMPNIPSLTSIELDSIADAAGYDPDTGICSRGLKVYSLTTYTSTGTGMMPVMLNTYESWTGSTMYGEKYYRGSFDTPTNPKPLWR